MTAIWHQQSGDWEPLAPAGFVDEAALHGLVEVSPQLLPLAGTPSLVILGREVALGGNSADLIAVEPSGRLAVIEIKLARNAEARRAIVAQVLTYAAFLQGLDVQTLEGSVLARHLAVRGVQSVAAAAAQADQEGSFSEHDFETGLADCLATGHFRLVLVLDSAPDELVRLCGYLESVADRLLIDLVTIAAYEVNGSTVLVPQRVNPESRPRPDQPPAGARRASEGVLSFGAERFEVRVAEQPEEARPILYRLAEWAATLESEGLVRLQTYEGKSHVTLLPRMTPDNRGLVTVAIAGRPLWFFRSVWERRAPEHIQRVEHILGASIGQGSTAEASEELLSAIHEAYRAAAGGERSILHEE